MSAELNSLRAETDPELRAEGLMNFASRQERAGREELAASLYAELQDTPVQERANARLHALLGDGDNLGLRAEVLLRRFAREATDPALLLGMGAAGTVFRATRLAFLARSGAAEAQVLTRGLGARASASLLAFAAEAPTFTLATRLGHEALGRSQDWSLRAVGRDIGSSALFLGGMRLSGAAFGGLHRRLGGASTGYAPILIRQTGMLGGIMLGHGLERAAGLREAQPLSATMLDSLVMLLQFNVAGRLSQAAMGSRFRAWESSLEQRSAALQYTMNFPRFPEGPRALGLAPELVPALSGAGIRERASGEGEVQGPQRAFMVGKGREGYDRRGLEALQELRRMRFVNEAEPDMELRRWIEAQPMPIAVAVVDGIKLPPTRMVNQRFERAFSVREGNLVGKSIAEILPQGTSGSFVNSRVFSQMAGILLKGWAEFDPTPMNILGRRVIGAGVYRKIGSQAYAFGIFTEIEGASPAVASPESAASSAPPVRTPPAPRVTGSVDLSSARNHFKASRAELGRSSDKKPDDEGSQ